MDIRERLRTNSGIEPEKKWRQKPLSVLGRHQIGGPEEHERHPKNDGQPSLKKFAGTQAGILICRGGLTNCSRQVNLAAKMSASSAPTLVFEPLYMERPWGGRRLETVFGRPLPPGRKIGESWEIVDRQEAQSIVKNGTWAGRTLHDLWRDHRPEVFGEHLPDSARFPILAKLLDAEETLSLQVHPAATRSALEPGESKTEMWYFAQAEAGAEIYAGLRRGVDRAQLERALQKGDPIPLVHRIAIKTGTSFFVPSGRLHAIGAGNLLVEIQQNSDTTYRLFDWHRVDTAGRPRSLQIDEALRSIDFDDFEPGLVQPHGELLVQCPHFQVEHWALEDVRAASDEPKFALFVCLEGALEVSGLWQKCGDFFLVPAASARLTELRPAAEGTRLLRVTLPAR